MTAYDFFGHQKQYRMSRTCIGLCTAAVNTKGFHVPGDAAAWSFLPKGLYFHKGIYCGLGFVTTGYPPPPYNAYNWVSLRLGGCAEAVLRGFSFVSHLNQERICILYSLQNIETEAQEHWTLLVEVLMRAHVGPRCNFFRSY